MSSVRTTSCRKIIWVIPSYLTQFARHKTEMLSLCICSLSLSLTVSLDICMLTALRNSRKEKKSVHRDHRSSLDPSLVPDYLTFLYLMPQVRTALANCCEHQSRRSTVMFRCSVCTLHSHRKTKVAFDL